MVHGNFAAWGRGGGKGGKCSKASSKVEDRFLAKGCWEQLKNVMQPNRCLEEKQNIGWS